MMQNTSTNVVTIGAAGAVTTLAFWVLGYFAPDFMATAPIGAEAALTALVSCLVGYFAPANVPGSQP